MLQSFETIFALQCQLTYREEETAFSKTLDKGIELFEKRIRALDGGKTLSGEDAFQLYDTFGFPLDLTQVLSTICVSLEPDLESTGLEPTDVATRFIRLSFLMIGLR